MQPIKAGARQGTCAPPLFTLMLAVLALVWPQTVAAHHILGRPSYNLNEDSNTPSSMQGEMQIGDYTVTYMVYPAFPRPGAPGRIHLYASRNSDGKPFAGEVHFTVRESSWLSWLGFDKPAEPMGTQTLDDGVFRQHFAFRNKGDYLISARFNDGDVPYIIDFPLRVGAPPAFGPIGIAVGVVLVLLLGVTLIQRRRSMTGKLREAHDRRS